MPQSSIGKSKTGKQMGITTDVTTICGKKRISQHKMSAAVSN